MAAKAVTTGSSSGSDKTRPDATLMAELLISAVREAQGIPGVLVRDIYLDPDAVFVRLQALRDEGVDLRIAYLNADASPAAVAAGIPTEVFSTEVEDAERWRNEVGLEALVVVITESDAAKLTSLEEFRLIGPAHLRSLLVDRAIAHFDEVNDVLPRWWTIIGKDDQISFFDLVDYYLALEGLSAEDAKSQSAVQINRLGLLPDAAFFDGPAEKQLQARRDENRTLAQRLANFSEEDRNKVDKALAEESDVDRRAELRQHLRDLQEYRRGGQLCLTAADARQLLKVKSAKPKSKKKGDEDDGDGGGGDAKPPPPKNLTALAVDVLLQPSPPEGNGDADADGDGGGDDGGGGGDTSTSALDGAMTALRNELQDLDENDKLGDTVRPLSVKVALPSGTEIDEEIKTDVLNLVGRVVDESKYGGLITAHGDDIVEMVRNFQQSSEVVIAWGAVKIRKLIDAFASDSTEFEATRTAFNDFDAARKALLPHVRELCIAPLPVTAAPATGALVRRVVETYQVLIAKTAQAYSALHQRYGDDARALAELIMLIDTVFLQSDDALIALMTPLHPLLLWHYVEYARVITEQRDTLDERDRALVRSEFDTGGVPLFLASLGVPRLVGETAPLSLPFSGKFGGLPHFSERATARDPKDGVRPIRRLVEAFIAMHPAAAEGLRVALLDPPDAGAFLSMACDLAETAPVRLRGAHISVLRRGHTNGAELNLSADEERRVQQRFGDHLDRRFTFETLAVGPLDLAPPDGLMAHIYVVFDQTKRISASAGGLLQKIQPLANRRRLAYHISNDTLDLEPELGGILADYSSFARLAVGSSIVSYQTIHQNEELQQRFRDGAQHVPWYVVVDGHVDRDLDLGGLRVLTDREGTRDVAAFARTPDAFRRSLRDVVRQFNTAVKDEMLDTLLASLSELLDTGLLVLRPSAKTGEIVHAQVKGVLGLMVAVQALKATTPPGVDRIILSLDDEQARRWLHLNEDRDNSRSDLLVIDGGDDGFTVTVVEVKARQDVSAEYAVVSGEVSGPAINQLLSTYRILRRVFDVTTPDLLLTPSRREIIREHLYRELSKASYSSEMKKRWAERSRKLFDEGADVDIRCALIDVQLGVAAASLEVSREVHAADGDQPPIAVSLLHLNEDGVPGLEEALTPPEAPETPEPPDGEEPSGGSGSNNPKEPGPDGGGTAAAAATPDAGTPTHAGAKPAATDTTPTGENRPRVLLGMAAATYGAQREVWFDPQNPDQALSNPHISISGETGSGKTQATKAILHEFMPELPALILDFKDDYSKADYAAAEGFAVHDASYGSLPFNPMVPPIDPQSGRANPTAHMHELAGMLQRIYNLGDQQAYQLREAMKETYAINGIGTKPFVPTPEQKYLPFEAIRDVLVREKANTLLGRLSPVFDLGLFSEGDAAHSLNDLLASPTVIRLSQLPGDQVKNAVAEFFLMALYSFLIRREHPHRMERLLVLDEAWRLVNSPFLEPLMREGRAFGLGVVIATQFPRDLPDQIAGSTATRVFFNQTKAEQVREIQRTLVGKTSGQEADHLGSLIRGLAPLECVLQNIHYKPWVRLKAIPYYARLSDGANANEESES
ncbi:AAA-like domain [Actinobacteria bacterium IMCC26207]|nr:AAA-like domain [Actinobacteria bacterium IMCC26207]